jgi:hypothetical protein
LLWNQFHQQLGRECNRLITSTNIQLQSFRVPFDRQLLEAKLALNLIASADMPLIALDALEAGIDGTATRRLAALERPTYFEVAEVLPRVMKEWEIVQIPIGEAALRMARDIAQDILRSGEDPLRYIRDFEGLWIRADYAKELSSLGTLDDEVSIAQSNGQSLVLIREWVTDRLRDFVRSHNPISNC